MPIPQPEQPPNYACPQIEQGATFYAAKQQEQFFIKLLNTSIKDSYKHLGLVHRLELHIDLFKWQEDGMLHFSERERINDLQQQVYTTLQHHFKALFAYRSTGKSKRTYVFYLEHIENIDLVLLEVLKLFPEYAYHKALFMDKQWSFYQEALLELKNTEIDFNKTLEFDTELPRNAHSKSIYFRDQQDQKILQTKLYNKWFILQKKAHHSAVGTFPYKLLVTPNLESYPLAYKAGEMDLWAIAKSCRNIK